jgi:hypothetical protein
MRRLSLRLALTAALLAQCSVQIALGAEPATKSLDYFVGTWNCAHRVGDFSGVYTTIYAPVLGDKWLKQIYDFPATQSEPAVHAEYFVGYDRRVERWIRFGAHSNGMYFGMKSISATDTTIHYTYVLPGSAGEATWTKKSDTQYTVDGPTYTENGKPVTEHHVCTKTS